MRSFWPQPGQDENELLDGNSDRRLVFGHFHEKVVMPTDDATITILPPWYETGEAMRIDPATGEFEFVVV